MENEKLIAPALNYPESSEKANEYLRLVLPMLVKFQLPPNPVNFTLCYEQVSGTNLELSNILDKVLNEEKGLTRQAATELYRRYIWDVDRRAVEKQSKDLYMVMTDTISEIDHTASQASKSSKAIENCSEKMEAYDDLHEMRNVIADVVSETKSIAESSHQMQKMLSETKQEVESLREELERSREQATTDPLTGLLNRRAFDQELMKVSDEANQSRENLGLLIIDIDKFKRVNDTYGHLIGDKVIRFVAQQISNNIKGKDIVARIGGEEFAILLPSTQLDNARMLAESIRKNIERSKLKRADTSEPIGGVTISIGVTAYKHGEITDDFIQRADDALYKSKNSGRNRVSISF
ncbi:MAG: GGDEF domain-containing protein [Pseudomonadota bacterium]